MSTSALIGRNPTEISRSCNHCGDGPFFTFRTVRPSTQLHASVSSIAQSTALGPTPASATGANGRNVPSPAAARSRATPRTDSASPRFGVTAMSITGSSSFAQLA